MSAQVAVMVPDERMQDGAGDEPAAAEQDQDRSQLRGAAEAEAQRPRGRPGRAESAHIKDDLSRRRRPRPMAVPPRAPLHEEGHEGVDAEDRRAHETRRKGRVRPVRAWWKSAGGMSGCSRRACCRANTARRITPPRMRATRITGVSGPARLLQDGEKERGDPAGQEQGSAHVDGGRAAWRGTRSSSWPRGRRR